MKNMGEIDRRIAGTELEAMIPKGAAGQRAAVQGTFNQAAAAFQLLPNQEEGKGRWTAGYFRSHPIRAFPGAKRLRKLVEEAKVPDDWLGTVSDPITHSMLEAGFWAYTRELRRLTSSF
jgi:hypothetical protein